MLLDDSKKCSGGFGDGADVGYSAVLLGFVYGGIARFPKPEPGRAGGDTNANRDGSIVGIRYISVLHGLLQRACLAE